MKLKELNIFGVTCISSGSCDSQKDDEIDYLEECIGAIGTWQVCVSIAAVMTRYIAMGNLLSFVFLIPKTDLFCVEFKNNVTIQVENNTCYDNCSKYVYYSDVMQTNLISDFDLICEREWLADFTQTSLMFGVVLGVSTFGWISDRYGRRIALILSTTLNILFMISNSFSPSYWIFNCLRFLTGIPTGGSLILGVIVMLEVVGKRYRENAACFSIIPDALAQASLALYAYLLSIWNTFSLVHGLISIVILILICFVPESPRWLISRGKVDQALAIIHKAAKYNKLSTDHINNTVMKHVEKMKETTTEKTSVSYFDLIKYKSLRYTTVAIFVVWVTCSITYFGIYQYTAVISTNIYVTVAVSGLIQIPLLYFQILLTKTFNRRTSLIIVFIITGSTAVGVIFTPRGHWSTTTLGVIGFCASLTIYTIAYIYQTELYPTPLRNMSFGFGSAAGKAGGMIAPFIATLSPMWVPSLLFCVISVIAACFCFLIPETKGKNLKDTID